MGYNNISLKLRRQIQDSIKGEKLTEYFIPAYDIWVMQLDDLPAANEEEDWDELFEIAIILEPTVVGFLWWYTYKKYVVNERTKAYDELFRYCLKIYRKLPVVSRIFINSTKRYGYFYSMAVHRKMTKKQVAVLATHLRVSPIKMYHWYNEANKRAKHKENKVEPHVLKEVKRLLKKLPLNNRVTT